MVGTEFYYAVFPRHFKKVLKDKNYRKAKMKRELGWMKKIGNDPALFLMSTIFQIYIHVYRESRLNKIESISLASLAYQLITLSIPISTLFTTFYAE